MPEKIATERRTRGDRWRSTMTVALSQAGPAPRPLVDRAVDAGIALADDEARADRVKLRDLRILLERQRDDGAAMSRRHLRGTPGQLAGVRLRMAALEGLRILEREP